MRLLCFAPLLLLSLPLSFAYEVVAEWTWLDVEYPTQEDKDEALASGEFIPENMCPIGIKARRFYSYIIPICKL